MDGGETTAGGTARPLLFVSYSRTALEALGAAARARMAGKVIGVTGSVGKTGVKEAIFAALDRASRGAAHRSVKSYNNHVGVPLSLARMPRDTRFGVFEMGMNHAGELSALTRLVRPHVAIVTTIASAHRTPKKVLEYSQSAERRGLKSAAYPNKGLHYLGGLTEATETLLCFALMCLLPQHFAVLAYGFAALCACGAN